MSQGRLLLLTLTSLLLLNCSGEEQTPPAPQITIADLVGTSWELVEMTVMGGFVFAPDDPAKYTLDIRQDNRLTGDSDCNTFTANWSEGETGDGFQVINYDASRSMCISGSLHNYYSLYLRDVVAMDASADAISLRTTTPDVLLQFRQAE